MGLSIGQQLRGLLTAAATGRRGEHIETLQKFLRVIEEPHSHWSRSASIVSDLNGSIGKLAKELGPVAFMQGKAAKPDETVPSPVVLGYYAITGDPWMGERLVEGFMGENRGYARLVLSVLRWTGTVLVCAVWVAILIALLVLVLFHSGPS